MLPEAAGRGQHFRSPRRQIKLTKALPWPVGRYRKILPALRTNQIAGFVTVPSEKKIILVMYQTLNSENENLIFEVVFLFFTFYRGEGREAGELLVTAQRTRIMKAHLVAHRYK